MGQLDATLWKLKRNLDLWPPSERHLAFLCGIRYRLESLEGLQIQHIDGEGVWRFGVCLGFEADAGIGYRPEVQIVAKLGKMLVHGRSDSLIFNPEQNLLGKNSLSAGAQFIQGRSHDLEKRSGRVAHIFENKTSNRYTYSLIWWDTPEDSRRILGELHTHWQVWRVCRRNSALLGWDVDAVHQLNQSGFDFRQRTKKMRDAVYVDPAIHCHRLHNDFPILTVVVHCCHHRCKRTLTCEYGCRERASEFLTGFFSTSSTNGRQKRVELGRRR